MAQYEVDLFAGGHPFWCVDQEHKLRDWIEARRSSRFTQARSLPTVKTTSLGPSGTAIRLRWTALEARDAWQAAARAHEIIAAAFPEVAASSSLRVEATPKTEADSRAERWTKQAEARR